MNCQNRGRNGEKSRFHRWGAAGLCAMAIATSGSAVANPTLDARTKQVMLQAINDEYHARAFYSAVINKFGNVRPFSNIVQAENQHVKLWNSLFTKYGLPIPKDTFAGKIQAPDTFKTACRMGVEAEVSTVKMYDKFLIFIHHPDLRSAFMQLRQVSQNNHLRAFHHCAN